MQRRGVAFVSSPGVDDLSKICAGMVTAATPHPASLRVTVGRSDLRHICQAAARRLTSRLAGAFRRAVVIADWPLRTLPPQLLAGEAGAVDQRLELRPHDLRMHAREICHLRKAAVRARDHVLAPDEAAKRTIRSATSSGCSTMLVAWLITPGISTVSFGSLQLLPQPPFVLVPRIGELDGVAAGAHLQNEIGDVLERDVRRVRARPAAPADVIPDLVARQSLDGVVDDLDLLGEPAAVVLQASWAAPSGRSSRRRGHRRAAPGSRHR